MILCSSQPHGGARFVKTGLFLVSGRDFACQQEISLVLPKNSAHPLQDGIWIACLAITRGSCVFNTREHRVLRDATVRKRNSRAWRTPRNDFGFLDGNI